MSACIMPCAAPSSKNPHATAACESAALSPITFLPYPSLVSGTYSRVFPYPRVLTTCAGPEPTPMPPAPPAPMLC